MSVRLGLLNYTEEGFLTEKMEEELDKVQNKNEILHLNICFNRLTSIPNTLAEFKNLKILRSSSNMLYSIDNLPPSISFLDISNNNLTKLPDLSSCSKLRTLIISNNKLTKLPKLPKSLRNLIVDNNSLDNFSSKDLNLEVLDLSHNKLRHFSDDLHKMPNLEILLLSENKYKLKYPDKPITCPALKHLFMRSVNQDHKNFFTKSNSKKFNQYKF